MSSSNCLRQFDARRDLVPVADLIEMCFQDTLDPDGRRYLQRMRSIAAQPRLLRWAVSSADWGGIPFFGFVWEQDGQIVGNVSLIPYKTQGKRFYLIANVAVHPDYRRRGIAKQLTLQAIYFAKQRQAPSVWLHVRQENEAANNLYQDLGFRERARRTTWVCNGELSISTLPSKFKITPARGRHWEDQRYWLSRNYPSELAWYTYFDLNIFNPGVFGSLYRILKQAYVYQWAAFREKKWLGSISWQFSPGYSNVLWLSTPTEVDDQVIQDLLFFARKNTPTNRPLTLEFPAGQYPLAFQTAGFNCHQTLIWMDLVL